VASGFLVLAWLAPDRVAGVTFAGVGALGLLAAVQLALSLLILLATALVGQNRRVHGGLLVAWGVVGLFVGLGLWAGALLALAGGLLSLARGERRLRWGRRPAV
jgi:hypothetical protein